MKKQIRKNRTNDVRMMQYALQKKLEGRENL